MSAPAGYGKTTLLAQWSESDPRPFAWLSIEPAWNDPSVFLTYLAHALEAVVPVDVDSLEGLVAPHVVEREMVLAQLARAVTQAKEPFVLVFDDTHHLEGREPLAMIETIAASLPPDAQLAFSCREATALPCDRLRAQGKVLDVGVNDLRFNASDARALVAAAGGELSATDLNDLMDRTEGWAAGLYLAVLSRQSRPFPSAVERSSDAEQLVADYIRSEILGDLPPNLRDFLVRTSAFDELCGSLCDDALGRTGSGGVLAELAADNLLVIPLDREGEWFRYHPLLRSVLRQELARMKPGAESDLAARASDWAVQAGRIDDAVRYAQVAGDVFRVAAIVRVAALKYYATGRAELLRSWVDWLWRSDCVDGGVAVLGAWLALVSGRSAEADAWVAIAGRASPEEEMPDGSLLAAWVATLHAAMANNPGRMRAQAQKAVKELSPKSQWRATALMMLGAAQYLQGDVDLGDRTLGDAGELGLKVGGHAAAALSLTLRGCIAIDRGEWERAERLLDEAQVLLDRSHLNDYASAAATFAVRARILAHRGQQDDAGVEVSRAERLLELHTRALPFLAVHTRVQLAWAQLARGDAHSADQRLHEANQLLRAGPDLGELSHEAMRLEEAVAAQATASMNGAHLSPAERRLMPYLATQLTYREVAEVLFVSVHTVRAQVASIYRKLGVASRSAAVDQGRTLGILDGRAPIGPGVDPF